MIAALIRFAGDFAYAVGNGLHLAAAQFEPAPFDVKITNGPEES